MGVAALVLGILGLLLSFLGPIGFIGAIFGLIALALGILGRKGAAEAGQPTGTATAGLVLGAVSIVLGLTISITCVMWAKRVAHDIEEGVKNPSNWHTPSKPLTGPVVKVTPKQLMADYAANEVSGDDKYKGKTLELTGKAESISKDFVGNVYINLESGEPMKTIQVYFNSEDTKKISELKSGQTVTVQGRCEGMILNLSVVLRDAVLK